ncbi:MAG TPA: DinB family protein [Bryobacteraceae bacterium]|nr:DinB family protein [Bryobacteraceae bacterium]
MDLGDAGRSSIKGRDIAFYQNTIREVREKTLAEFAKRDDAWLPTPLKRPGWGGGPINNYCLWFHVCEHISHHAGQIDLLMKRLANAKPDGSVG